MAAGDIILSDGTTITPEDLQKIAAAVEDLIASTAKDPGQYEEVSSLTGVSSLPAFQVLGSTYKLVRVALSVLKGVDGREVFLQVNQDKTYIQWRYTDGNWQNLVALSDLKGTAGDTPVFRTGSTGIEWKYTSEEDTAYRVLVPYDDLKLKFSDLTSEQKDELKLHFSDLTETDKAELMKPATDAAKEVREQMSQIKEEANTAISNVNTAKVSAEAATKAANDAAALANAAAGQATQSAENANAAVERADDTIASAETATKSATDAALAANTAKENADKAANTAKAAATLANEKAGLADTAALAANTAKEDTIVATGKANTAADRANRAAEAAEGVISGLQPDWNVIDPVNKNYIKNKPEIPTLEAIPDENTLSYVNTDGTTINFRIGDDVRVAEDGEYVFYRLYDLAGGKASWQESGSGTALPGNVYLTGANYYNESVRTIKQGYLSNE